METHVLTQHQRRKRSAPQWLRAAFKKKKIIIETEMLRFLMSELLWIKDVCFLRQRVCRKKENRTTVSDDVVMLLCCLSVFLPVDDGAFSSRKGFHGVVFPIGRQGCGHHTRPCDRCYHLTNQSIN